MLRPKRGGWVSRKLFSSSEIKERERGKRKIIVSISKL
jgi:hypothetical protein